jgi:hypothetical protein
MSGKPQRTRGWSVIGWVGTAVLVAAALSGCSRPATQNGDPVKVQQLAQADLARWDQAVGAAGGGSGFVLVGQATIMTGSWGPDPSFGSNGKMAFMAGDFEAATSLPSDTPPDGVVRWQNGSTQTVGMISAQQALAEIKAEGSGSCSDCVPLRVTGGKLTTADYQTSHGSATAPTWEFTLQGTDTTIQHLAAAHPVNVVPPTYDPSTYMSLISIQSATVAAGGLTLTVTFEGAPKDAGGSCGADYTAQAVESSTAVVVIVTEHPGFGLSMACSAVGAFRTADATLATPLGNRAVLEVAQGMPVSVTPAP